jgi:outer membrane receptor protein involved in Fe transport
MAERNRRRARRLMEGAALAALLNAAPLAAQTEGMVAAAPDESDIIVTARRREENLQDVPLSVTAITSETIERQGLQSIVDIAQVTPGLSFRQAFGRNFDRPVIRGMSNIQGSPNAAFFIDGIFVTGSISSYNLDNLERVEVIRGPQSALFGRNTFSGAINYITRQPGNDPRGRAALTWGTDGLRELSGFVSGPLVRDRLFAEVNARVYEFGGQYENLADPREKLGRERSQSVGVILRATPTAGLALTGRFNYLADQDGHFPIALIGRRFGQTLPVAGQLVNNGALNCFQPELIGLGPAPALRPVARTRTRGYFCGELPTPTQYAVNTDVYRAAGFGDALKRETWRASLRADAEFGGWAFQATGGYNHRRQTTAVDQDYTERRVLGFETFDSGGTRDWSFDAKLLSPVDQRIRGLVGVYYYKEESLDDGFSGSLTFPSTPVPRPWVIGDDPARIARNAVFDNSVENRAVFGQVQFDVVETLTLSAEGRYQVEDLTTSGTSTANVSGTVFSRSVTAPLGQATFRKFLPRFTLDWRATEDVLLYGVVARGNKPGGFNSGVYNAIYEDSEVARLVGLGLDTFDEENAWTYEIGVKSQFADRRVTLNAAAYQIDWDNQQLTQSIQVARRDGVLGSLSFTSNVGKSRVRGFEIESSARVADGVSLRLGYAFTDAKIRDFVADDQADLYITAQDLATLNAQAPLPNFVTAPSLAGTGLTSFAPCLGASPDPRCTGAVLVYAQGYLTQLIAASPARFDAVNALLELRGNSAGNRLPRVPQHQLTLGAEYAADLTTDLGLFLNANLAYESKRYIQVDNLGWSGDSWNLNLRAGLEYRGWSLTAFLTNALNDRTPADILRLIDTGQTFFRPALRPGEATAFIGGTNVSSANIRDFAVTPPRLRNFGATLAYRF